MPDWFEQNAPKQAAPQRTWGDEATDYLQGVWSQMNPVTIATGLRDVVNNPIQTVQAMGAAQGDLAMQAKDAFEKGDYLSGLRHSFNYLIPMLGVQMNEAGNKAAEGKLAEAMGEATGMGVMQGIPLITRAARNLPSVFFRNRNPVEAAALNYVQSEGVPVPAGTASGNPLLKTAQKVVAYTPGGAIVAGPAERATTEGLRDLSVRLSDRAHPTPVTAEQAGETLRTTLTKSAEQSAKTAQGHYALLEAAEQDPANIRNVQVRLKRDPKTRKLDPVMEDVPLPVDIRAIQSKLKPIYAHMSQWWQPALRSSSAGFQAIKSILEADHHVPASVAEAGLGGLKELAREGNPKGAGLAKMIISELQDTIDNAVEATAGPKVVKGLQEGRVSTAKQYGTLDVLNDLREEPVQAFGQMVWSKDTGIERLRGIAKEAPGELRKVGRAYLEGLMEKAKAEGGFGHSQGIHHEWQNLGPQTKQLLFENPKLIADLDKFFLAAKKIAENPNPSGTAFTNLVAGGLAMGPGSRVLFEHPIATTVGLASNYALAKLLYTPRGVQLLTKALHTPISNKAATAAITAQVLNMVGDETEKQRQDEYLRKQRKTLLPYEYANPALDPRR